MSIIPAMYNTHIQIKGYATLVDFLPANAASYPVGNGETVADVLKRLRIPQDMVNIITINGDMAEPEAVLIHKDVLGLFPLVGGG